MKPIIGSVLFTILLFISVIHIYWGFGGKAGSLAAVPTKKNNVPVIKPGPVSCMAVALGLLSFGGYVLIKSGIINFHLPGWISNYGLWIISGIFLLRAIGEFKYVGFSKKIRYTRFGKLDTKYYSPLCLLLSLLGIILEFIS
jgi:Protein of unknown function (DUF3995)